MGKKNNTIILFSLCRHFINWSQNLRARESFVGSCLSIFFFTANEISFFMWLILSFTDSEFLFSRLIIREMLN